MFNVKDIGYRGVLSKDPKTLQDEFGYDLADANDAFNRRVAEVREKAKRYNNQIGFLKKDEELQSINEEVKELLRIQSDFSDPLDIQRNNESWLRNTLADIDGRGGAFAGELKAVAIAGFDLASENGVRIIQDKVRTKALTERDNRSGVIAQYLKGGDIDQSLEGIEELTAFTNSLGFEGILSPDEVKAYNSHTKNVGYSGVVRIAYQQNRWISASENNKEALKDMEEKVKIFKPLFPFVEPEVKTAFLERLERLKAGENTLDLRTTEVEWKRSVGNAMSGMITSKELSDFWYGNALPKFNQALKSKYVTNEGKAKVKIAKETGSTTVRLFNELARAGEEINGNGKPFNIKNNPLIDKRKTPKEIFDHFGFSKTGPGGQLMLELRSQLPFDRKDNVQSNVNIYRYISNLAGINTELPERSINSLGARMEREKHIDYLMGGEGGISSYSADAFKKHLQNPDPDVRDELNFVISDNPMLLPLVEKHRSKPENTAITTTIREFTLSKPELGMDINDFFTLNTQLKNNGYARSAHDSIKKYIYKTYADDPSLNDLARKNNISIDGVAMALANSTYVHMVKKYGSQSAPEEFLSTQLTRASSNNFVYGTGDTNNVLDDMTAYSEELIGNLLGEQEVRGSVDVSDSDILKTPSGEGNLVLSVFGEGEFNFYQQNIRSRLLPDVGMRSIKPLEEVEYKKVRDYIEGLLGNNRVNLTKGRLRLLPHSGDVFKLAYVTEYDNVVALRDEDNDFIFFNTLFINKNSKKVKPENEASIIINILENSNAGL